MNLSVQRRVKQSVKQRAMLAMVALFLAVAMLATGLRAEDSKAQKGSGKPARTVRLLTVGNSFSQNATRYLKDVVQGSGNVLIQHRAVIGGSSLQQHWEKSQLHEKDPQDKAGLYSTQLGLKQELLAEPWDVVTIQQVSIRSHDVTTYRPFARQLHDYIKQHAPRAEVVLHQTWAYRQDDPRFAVADPKPGEPATEEAMYRGLTSAYTTIAAELKTRRIPVGDAFYLADSDPKWGYRRDTKFDFQNPRYPALPDQTHSLHVGYQWGKLPDGKPTLRMDGHHANMAGEYLGACVFFEFLFQESSVGNTFVPAGLNKAHALFLQETAHRAVVAAREKQPAGGGNDE